MQFRIATLIWATLVVATSLALGGAWGLLPAAYWIVGLWRLAAPRSRIDRPRGPSDDFVNLLVLIVVFGCCGLSIPYHDRGVRQRARRSACMYQLKQLSYALQSYCFANKTHPPAVAPDAAGKPAHSWRTLLLKDLDRIDLDRQYDRKQPWNSSANAAITAAPMPNFHCPSDSSAGIMAVATNYLAVVGPDTAWDPASKLRDVDTRIAIVDVDASGIGWAEPKDLAAEEFLSAFDRNADDPPTIRSPHGGGFHVAFGDGRAEWLPRRTPRALVETLLYKGLTPEAEKELRELQAREIDRDPTLHLEWRILAWIASIVAFGVHAFRFRRGQSQTEPQTQSAGDASRE